MKQKIRERIIRRLGGVPIWRAGRDPIPGWFLQPVESMIEQNVNGMFITVKYTAIDTKNDRRNSK